MAVRRLAETQPDSFAFTPANRAWAEREMAKFPPGRQASAVISLLWRAQEQEGWVTEPAIEAVAEILEMPQIRVLEVATFYTMFHLEPVGSKAHVQVCGTTPCLLRGAGALIDICRRRIHEQQHHRSADGAFSWEEVECLGACVNAPMVEISSDTYEDLTPESFEALLDALARGETPRPGPQNGRKYSMPITGATTLTDISYAPADVPARSQETSPVASTTASVATPPGVVRENAGGEVMEAERRRRKGTPMERRSGAADPRGRETEAQEIGRVDPTGRADEAAARSTGEEPGRPRGHAAKEEAAGRTGQDRAAEPRSDRDSSRGDRD